MKRVKTEGIPRVALWKCIYPQADVYGVARYGMAKVNK